MSGRWQGSTRKERLPADWYRKGGTRARILKRDRGICHVCLEPGADQVDHIEAGDDHSDENLAAIHEHPCHARKSSTEGAAVLKARAAARYRPAEPHPGLRRAT